MKSIFKITKAVSRILGYYEIAIDGIKFKFDPYHIDTWRRISSGTWEADSYKILSRYLNSSTVFYDIGAWIGPLSIYAAKICKNVVCFEPDPVAYQYLLWNIRLNGLKNVLPVNAAMTRNDGIVELANTGNLGNSETSLLRTGADGNRLDAISISLYTWLNLFKAETPGFLKIDIEGGEFELIPSIKEFLFRYKPIVYLSTHTPFLSASQRREQMDRILNVLRIYDNCLNERLEPVNLDDLTHEDVLNDFHSFLFLDMKINPNQNPDG